jgi:hypothetical protein
MLVLQVEYKRTLRLSICPKAMMLLMMMLMTIKKKKKRILKADYGMRRRAKMTKRR